MPGPLVTVTISESTARGAKAGPMLIAGHAILEMFLLIALLLGLAPLLKNEYFFIVIAFLGSIIMLWMAYGMFRSLPTLSIQTEASAGRKKNLLVSGILMSLANPYWIIWWATIGIGYIIHSQKLGPWGIGLFYIGHILGDLLWYAAISLAVAKGRKLFTDSTYRILIGICATFLMGFAFYLVISGAKAIL